jgi:hypothetical protein
MSLVGGDGAIFNDSVLASDVFIRTATYARTFADAAGVADAATRMPIKRVDDVVGVVDARTSVWRYDRLFDEAVKAVDAIGILHERTFRDVAPAVDQITTLQTKGLSDSFGVVDAITLTLDRASTRLEAWPTICYVADAGTSACYRLVADPASQLFIESVEEYSPEARSPAHAE